MQQYRLEQNYGWRLWSNTLKKHRFKVRMTPSKEIPKPSKPLRSIPSLWWELPTLSPGSGTSHPTPLHPRQESSCADARSRQQYSLHLAFPSSGWTHPAPPASLHLPYAPVPEPPRSWAQSSEAVSPVPKRGRGPVPWAGPQRRGWRGTAPRPPLSPTHPSEPAPRAGPATTATAPRPPPSLLWRRAKHAGT